MLGHTHTKKVSEWTAFVYKTVRSHFSNPNNNKKKATILAILTKK